MFVTEPPAGNPLLDFPNVVVTPHLGASTHEAQEKAGTQVVKSLRLALAGKFVPDAVNVQGGVVDEDVKPGLPLAEKLGQLFTALAGALAATLDVEVRGEIASKDVRVLQLAALKGVFADVVEDAVTYVNAPRSPNSGGWRSAWSPRPRARTGATWSACATLPGGQSVSVSGTLTGQRQVEKLVEVNGFDMEIALAEHMVMLSYTDRPGIVGVVGQILGSEGINIAGMQVSRDVRGGHALIALTVDSAIPPVVLEDITATIGAVSGRAVNLDMS